MLLLGEDPFQDWAKVVDCGDAPLTFLVSTEFLHYILQDLDSTIQTGQHSCTEAARSRPQGIREFPILFTTRFRVLGIWPACATHGGPGVEVVQPSMFEPSPSEHEI